MNSKEKTVVELIRDVTGTHKEIDEFDSLIYDIGMSSFEMCMLAHELEIKGGKTIDYKRFNHTTRVKDLSYLL